MKVIEDIEIFPPRKYYIDIDPKFVNFTNRCRVLPAQYYNDYNIYFELKKRYAPGENKYFPNGGFEVYGPEGSLHNYNLDEVIVHPFHLGMTKYFSQSQAAIKEREKDPNAPKGKRGRPRKPEGSTKPAYVPTGGKRGRKPLPPEIKALREAEKLAKKSNSTGKRGRPRKVK